MLSALLAGGFRVVNAVPAWIWLVVALLGWGAWQRHQAGVQAEAAKNAHSTALLSAARAQAEADARALEHKLSVNARKAADEQARRLAQTRAAAADAAAELERLRNIIQATGPAASNTDSNTSACRRSDDAAATYRQLFGACASAFAGMGRDAENLADQVAGLQGYIRATVPGVPDPPLPSAPASSASAAASAASQPAL